MQGPRVRAHRALVEGVEGVLQQRVQLEERPQLVVAELVDERLGHGHQLGVEGQVEGADGLLVARREVALGVIAHRDHLPDEEAHLVPELGEVGLDEIEGLPERRHPLGRVPAPEVQGVARLVGVELEHRQGVVVGGGQHAVGVEGVVGIGGRRRVHRHRAGAGLGGDGAGGIEGHRPGPLGERQREAQGQGEDPRRGRGAGERRLEGAGPGQPQAEDAGELAVEGIDPFRIPLAVAPLPEHPDQGAGGGVPDQARQGPGVLARRGPDGGLEPLGAPAPGRGQAHRRREAHQIAEDRPDGPGEDLPGGGGSGLGEGDVAGSQRRRGRPGQRGHRRQHRRARPPAPRRQKAL